MVIFYDKEGQIIQAEHNVMTPTFPFNLNLEGKVKHYKDKGLKFHAIEKEIGGDIFNYKAITDKNGEFVRLEQKDVKK